MGDTSTTAGPGADATKSDPGESSDTEFLRTVLAKEQRWRQSGFRWQLLLSQRELDLLTDNDRTGVGRTVGYYVLQSPRAESLFRSANIDAIRLRTGQSYSAALGKFFETREKRRLRG